MSMLNNSKAILTYGLNEKETKDFQATGHKVINISNFPDEELQMMVSIAKVITENPIMAVVTETSKEWQFNYLVEHLIEEREWYRSMQGGKA